ncbi:hypothetical protein, partial [Brevibacterium sp. UCMA 11754]|uniref:hypothetical protein n=1 Tax=Brevibacterium sp. UCMA 11754 TaxID=2749198 RepID=UPI001F43EE3B
MSNHQMIEIRGPACTTWRTSMSTSHWVRWSVSPCVSGSGKSSLAMGVLYAEGSRRYIEALSTYTRRRMSQAPRADVDRVSHVPAALALRQRPASPASDRPSARPP